MTSEPSHSRQNRPETDGRGFSFGKLKNTFFRALHSKIRVSSAVYFSKGLSPTARTVVRLPDDDDHHHYLTCARVRLHRFAKVCLPSRRRAIRRRRLANFNGI